MLSHNRLSCDALAPVAAIEALEMLRVAANPLEAGPIGPRMGAKSTWEAFPEALLRHKRLAWVALGATPMAEEELSRWVELVRAPEHGEAAREGL